MRVRISVTTGSRAPGHRSAATGGRVLVGNGKQALALMARRLRGLGVRAVLVPAYRCATMAAPFELEGLRVRGVPCGADLLMDAGALQQALVVEPGAAVLHCETYGAAAGAGLRAALRTAREAGSAVVLEASHSVLDRAVLLRAGAGAAGTADDGATDSSRAGDGRTAGGPADDDGPWDVVVASLRKTLPVPDGALLVWSGEGWTRGWDPAGDLVGRAPVDEGSTALGAALAAADARLHALAPGAPGFGTARLEVCELAERHEDAIEEALSPVAAGEAVVEALGRAAGGEAAWRGATAQDLRIRLGEALRVAAAPSGTPRGTRGADAVGAGPGRAPGPALRVLDAPWSGGVAVTGRAQALTALAEDLSARGLWGPALWDGSDAVGGRAVLARPLDWPGALIAAGRSGAWEDLGGEERVTGWPLVVTLPTDRPERVEELVAVVVRAAALG